MGKPNLKRSSLAFNLIRSHGFELEHFNDKKDTFKCELNVQHD